jgi:hypothetical protein
LIKKQGIIFQLSPVCRFETALYLGYRDGLLRAILNARQAINALGHVRRIGLVAFQFEYGLRTYAGAGSAAVALVLVNCNHVHGGNFLLRLYTLAILLQHLSAGFMLSIPVSAE